MSSFFNSPCAKEEPKETTNLITEPLVQEQENILSENVAPQKIVSTESESPVDSVNVKGVWGDHLSNKNQNVPKRSKSLLVGRSSSFQLSQKMFKSSSFSKRNPRKSLSMTKIKSKSDLSVTTSTPVQKNDVPDAIELTESLYGEKVKIIQQEHKIVTQSLNTVQQLIEGRNLTTNRTINQGWLERCGMGNILDILPEEPRRLSGISDSGVESMESSIHSLKESLQSTSTQTTDKSLHISDEEDFVFNSDSEEERRSKRIRNLRKIPSDVDHFTKRFCVSDLSFSYSQPLPVKPALDLLSNENRNETLDSKKITAQKEEILTLNEENSTKKETDELPKIKRTLSKRKLRRRIKINSDDDSDPEYFEETKKKPKRNTRTSRAKKNIEDVDDKKDSSPKTKRSVRGRSAKKEEVPDKDMDLLENDIRFGIESLEVVPRLPMKGSGTGDLITDFSRVLAFSEKFAENLTKEVKPKNKMTAKERLEQKIASGELNDNYVRVNLKKKVFVRGKKSFNFSKFKKNQWKERKKELASSAGSLDAADFAEKSGGACHLCGEKGHFARYCKARKGDDLLPLEHMDDSSDFPTLEEAEQMARRNALIAHSTRIDRLPKTSSHSADGEAEDFEDEFDFPDWDEEVPEAKVIVRNCLGYLLCIVIVLLIYSIFFSSKYRLAAKFPRNL